MKSYPKRIVAAIAGLALLAMPLALRSAAGGERPKSIVVGEITRPPFGWTQFCQNYAPKWECDTSPSAARVIVLSPATWNDLARVNLWVNENVRPITDEEHWGMIEHWSYPDDGYGDCDNYVLQKRKMLIEAGWPREALLITVVRDKSGDGHAVLTVKTDKGEFILDNQSQEIVLWSETGYRFVKRQSQTDPNVWVLLGDPRGATATSAAR
jgi:predicted transglutaminase-like cysteine proteinase